MEMVFERMNFEYMKKKILCLSILIIIVMAFFLYHNWPSCDTINHVAASLTVREGARPVIGINADTDHLAFGEVSPASSVRRSIIVEYEEKARVTVMGEGDLTSWIETNPETFSLASGEKKEVSFRLNVPENALPGNYTGEVYFCFQE